MIYLCNAFSYTYKYSTHMILYLTIHTLYICQAFQQYIAPTMQYADVVVPRGAENRVAMQLIVHHVKNQLEKVQEMKYYPCQ